MVCSSCNASNLDHARYCRACGKPLSASSQDSPGANAPPPVILQSPIPVDAPSLLPPQAVVPPPVTKPQPVAPAHAALRPSSEPRPRRVGKALVILLCIAGAVAYWDYKKQRDKLMGLAVLVQKVEDCAKVPNCDRNAAMTLAQLVAGNLADLPTRWLQQEKQGVRQHLSVAYDGLAGRHGADIVGPVPPPSIGNVGKGAVATNSMVWTVRVKPPVQHDGATARFVLDGMVLDTPEGHSLGHSIAQMLRRARFNGDPSASRDEASFWVELDDCDCTRGACRSWEQDYYDSQQKLLNRNITPHPTFDRPQPGVTPPLLEIINDICGMHRSHR